MYDSWVSVGSAAICMFYNDCLDHLCFYLSSLLQLQPVCTVLRLDKILIKYLAS